MGTTTINADLIQIIDEQNPNTSGTSASINDPAKAALVHFSLPSALQYKKITTIDLYLYSAPYNGKNFKASCYYLLGAFNSSVTWNTKPDVLEGGYYELILGSTSIAQYNHKTLFWPKYYSTNLFKLVFQNGFLVRNSADNSASLSTSLSQNPPYIVVTYEDADSFGMLRGDPSGGYISKAGAHTFRWSYTPPEDIIGSLSASNFRLAYRKGTSGDYTYIDCGTSLSYTFPAGTFSDTDTVQWYPLATLSNGTSLTSQNTYTLTTVEPALSAQGVSPSGTIEDGSQPITFTWNAWNSVGSSPSGADLQYSSDGGSTWTTLGSVSGSATSYAAAANTLPGGELSWRVRAINGDNVAGDWSAALRFINVAAPAAPSVSSDAAPFATITWDATGQQAYEVKIDGVSYGIHFGTEKTFTLSLPLTDGNHTAEVRVQGQYSLWSQPGSVIFTVANAAAGTIDLAGEFGIDAQLLWDASPAGTDYLIFRDGVQIGHTANNTFTDRRALGMHVWYVLLRQADGNYTKSNEVTGELAVEGPMIALLAGGPWISLRLTESSMARQTFTYHKTHTMRHYSGSPWPVIELTPYDDYAGEIQCAFKDANEARAFEALRGQIVILKIRDTVLIGGMMNLSKESNPLYVGYQFTIEQIAVEGIVDDTDS